jgi:hypothetical protein
MAPRDISPGAEWGEAIVEAIDHSPVMVLIFSSNSNESRQIRREVERAINKNVTIVPVRLEPAEPTRSLAYFMAGIHWLDALTLPLEQHFQRLAVSIKAFLRAAPGNEERDREQENGLRVPQDDQQYGERGAKQQQRAEEERRAPEGEQSQRAEDNDEGRSRLRDEEERQRRSPIAGRQVRVSRTALAEWKPAANRADPVEILIEQGKTRIQELLPIRYARMRTSPHAFLRGAAAIMAADFGSGSSTGLRVQACGDCHLFNFGVYATPEGTLVFDMMDFDETLPAPFEWDLKRLAASLAVAGRCEDTRARMQAARPRRC